MCTLQESFSWWKSKNKVKNSKKPKKNKNVPKISFEWFGIKKNDSICFMQMLWTISIHWCFQKIIGSKLFLWWSDTPQSRTFNVTFPFSVLLKWIMLWGIYFRLTCWTLKKFYKLYIIIVLYVKIVRLRVKKIITWSIRVTMTLREWQ